MSPINHRLTRLVPALFAATVSACSWLPFSQQAAKTPAEPPATVMRTIYNPVSGLSHEFAVGDLLAARNLPRIKVAATTADAGFIALARATRTPMPAPKELDPPSTPASVTEAAAAADSIALPAALRLDREFASISRMVPFGLGRAELGPLGRKAISELAPIALEARTLHVHGRTDASGSKEINEALASARAQTVAAAFVDAGVPVARIATTHCIDCFIAPNSTDRGRRMNRRVDVEMELPKTRIAGLPEPVHALETPPLMMSRTLSTPVALNLR